MARAKIRPIIHLFIFTQVSPNHYIMLLKIFYGVKETLHIFFPFQIFSRQKCQANTIPQQTTQNNVVNTQNLNQNVDHAINNVQKQPIPQHNVNLQQFASIPMQTFNAQQQGNSQHTNYQAVNQALNIQQVPQHYNLQHEISINNQQVIPSPKNVQQAAVVPVNSQQTSNLHTSTPQALIVKQPPPVQGLNVQQQASPVNLQQSQISFQQTSPQNFQQFVAQPVKVQQVAQQSVVPAANVQSQGSSQNCNMQKTTQTYAHIQQPSIVQSVPYHQRPVQQQDSIGVTQLNFQQPQTLQQMPMQPIDVQQQIPCNNMGGYQVISYQKPCQSSEVSQTLPMTVPLSTLSSNSNPTIIAAVPATMTIPSTASQTDQIYVLSPQNYLTSTSYSPRVVTDALQSTLSGSTIQVPVISVPNSVPSANSNFAPNCNQQFETENWSWSQIVPDIGMLSDVQFPIASLLGQPTSSVQSALLSTILSSIQSPSNSPQYVITPSYPTQTIISPQSSSSSKLSLKSLLPLLLNMVQEKYSNSGCQNCQCCNCCNCDCANKNVMQVNTEFKDHLTAEIPTEEDNEESEEIEEVSNQPTELKKPNIKNNTISNDSTEIDEVEDSSCEDDEIQHDDELDEQTNSEDEQQ